MDAYATLLELADKSGQMSIEKSHMYHNEDFVCEFVTAMFELHHLRGSRGSDGTKGTQEPLLTSFTTMRSYEFVHACLATSAKAILECHLSWQAQKRLLLSVFGEDDRG